MPCGHFYVTVNTKFGEPVEIFCRVGKAGGCQGALLQGVARLASLALQAGAPIRRVRLTLAGISCPSEVAGGPRSCLDALAKELKIEG
jgi:hypothetical protein